MDINSLFNFYSDDPDSSFYFRLPTPPSKADLVLVSVPWGVTLTSGNGTLYTPDAIIESSARVCRYDVASGTTIKGRVATADVDYDIQELAQHLNSDAKHLFQRLSSGGTIDGDYYRRKKNRIEAGFAEMHERVYGQVVSYVRQGKTIGIVGGDHSVSFGAVRALAERNDGLGILYLDSHCDLKSRFDILKYSPRSIAGSILKEIPGIHSMTQVGVCEATRSEFEIASSEPRLTIFTRGNVTERTGNGERWADICNEITATLPEKVYISLDVDVFESGSFPNVVYPVPGGMRFEDMMFLLRTVATSGREIVGFDVTEIVPAAENSIDAVNGAYLIARLAAMALESRSSRKER